jgi:hypothetical protein
VFAAFVLVTTMIAATPIVALADGAVAQGILAVLAMLAVAVTAWSIPPGEARHLSKLVGSVAICMAIPVIWMALQAAPMPLRSLSNPIWTSAEGALGESLPSSISVDPGATIIAITRYLTMIGIVIATTAVAINRRRAEMVLFWLAGAAVTAGILLVLHGLAHFSFGSEADDREVARSLMAGCVLGVPLTAAAAGHVLERLERRRMNADTLPVRFVAALAGSVGGLAICLTALAFAATMQLLLIAACGFMVVAGVSIIRRLSVGLWFVAASAAAVIIIIVAFVSTRSSGYGDVTLRYADAPARSIAIAETVMADAAWAGSGGGAYDALLPLYLGVEDNIGRLSAPTAAAKISVELGKPALWVIVVMVVLAVGFLLRGALTRGRDSFYSIAVISSTIVFSLEAFSDASGFATSVGVLASVAFGLGIGQSASRSIRP